MCIKMKFASFFNAFFYYLKFKKNPKVYQNIGSFFLPTKTKRIRIISSFVSMLGVINT